LTEKPLENLEGQNFIVKYHFLKKGVQQNDLLGRKVLDWKLEIEQILFFKMKQKKRENSHICYQLDFNFGSINPIKNIIWQIINV